MLSALETVLCHTILRYSLHYAAVDIHLFAEKIGTKDYYAS